MSVRSICEFNHDFAHQIADDPERFVEALSRFLNSADDENAERLKRFGMRIATSAHHSDTRAAEVNGRRYEFG